MDCGPTCLRMIASYYDKNFYSGPMKNWSRIMQEGSSMLDIMDAAYSLGIISIGLEIDINRLALTKITTIC